MKRLLVSVHDAAPSTLEAVLEVDSMLHGAGIGSVYCLLVVPDMWEREPLGEHPGFTDRVKRLAEGGVEIALHGYCHLDLTGQSSPGTRLAASVMTGGEGEFLGLSAEESRDRLERGLALFRDVLGTGSVPGFVAPAWLFRKSLLPVLSGLGIPWTEDHRRILFPSGESEPIVSPVICFSTRTALRRLLSLAWARMAPALLAGFGTLRVALHPSDVTCSSLYRRIPGMLSRLLAGRETVLYRDLLR